MFLYAVGLLINGTMVDTFNPKTILIAALFLVTFVVVFIGLGSLSSMFTIYFYIQFFAIDGFIQAAGWPSCLAIFSNWFGKRSRGAILGLLATSKNTGDIL